MQGDALPELILNEQDLHVDRSLPVPSQKSNIVVPAKRTSKESEEAISLRDAERNSVRDKFNRFINEESQKKKYIRKTWATEDDIMKQGYLNTITDFQLKEYKNLIQLLKVQLSWWKSGYSASLNPDILKTEISDFKDSLSDALATYEDALKDKELRNTEFIQRRIDEKNEKGDTTDASGDSNPWDSVKNFSIELGSPEDKERQAAAVKKAEDSRKKNILNRSTWDDVTDSWAIIVGSMGIILYIVFGLRFASFSVNEIFYRKLPYKVLIFIYVFLFTPFIFPYFIFKVIRTWLYPDTYPAPVYRCFFPAYGYDANKTPITASDAWFGYREDSDTLNYIEKMVNAEIKEKRDVLKESAWPLIQAQVAKLIFSLENPIPKGC